MKKIKNIISFILRSFILGDICLLLSYIFIYLVDKEVYVQEILRLTDIRILLLQIIVFGLIWIIGALMAKVFFTIFIKAKEIEKNSLKNILKVYLKIFLYEFVLFIILYIILELLKQYISENIIIGYELNFVLSLILFSIFYMSKLTTKELNEKLERKRNNIVNS